MRYLRTIIAVLKGKESMYRSYIKFPNPIHAHLSSYVWEMPALCAALGVPRVKCMRAPKIAIGELGGGWGLDETKRAFDKWQLPHPNFEIIRGRNQPGSSADGEVKLDVDVSAAAALCTGDLTPTIGVAFGGNSDAEFLACQKAMNDWGADTQSWSWGGAEANWNRSTVAQHVQLHQAAGCPIFCAAGDDGSADGLAGVNADFPGSSPLVIDCNGTMFFPGQPHQVWNDGAGGGATGGCFSSFFAANPALQLGAPMVAGPQGPAWIAACVAGPASPRTGYNILLNGQWGPIGGTSAVSPLYAGIFAALIAAGLPKASLLDRLWRHQSAFEDVVTGNNGRFHAQAGPDLCTGLGVAKFTQLWTDLMASIPAPPVTPPTPLPPPTVPPTRTQTLFDLRGGIVGSFIPV